MGLSLPYNGARREWGRPIEPPVLITQEKVENERTVDRC